MVVTHDFADFDALAAAAAAQLLYPGALIVLGRMGPGPREFLALHRDVLETVDPRALDASAVRRVIVVDVRRAQRLAFLPELLSRIESRDPTLEVHVWDHHGASVDDLPAHLAVVEPVGSATTLLAEALQRRAIEVGPIRATLMAIGIHVDTGSLTFAASSARDAAALAWLMDRGARLAVLNRYLRTPFGATQRDTLRDLLGACVVESIGGARVAFAMLGESVGRLDEVVSEATALQDVHALFAIAPTRGGAQVVARSRVPFIDVGRVVSAVGGGGHATASAATVREMDPPALRATLLEQLRRDPPRPQRVRDVMSSPVRTIGTKAPLREAQKLLQHGRWTGLPVVKEGKVVGVVSHRDVERAATERQLDRPVGHEMSAPARTISDDALVEEAQAIMESEDIGRLPVLRDDKLVGIVTRSDLLGFLYGPDE